MELHGGGWEPLTHTSKYAYTAVAESARGVVSATSGGVTQTGYNNFNPAAGIGWAVDLTLNFRKMEMYILLLDIRDGEK